MTDHHQHPHTRPTAPRQGSAPACATSGSRHYAARRGSRRRVVNKPEKLKVAQQFARLGVDVIEAGFPASKATSSRRHDRPRGRRPRITGLARGTERDIRTCSDAIEDAERPLAFTPSSRPPSPPGVPDRKDGGRAQTHQGVVGLAARLAAHTPGRRRVLRHRREPLQVRLPRRGVGTAISAAQPRSTCPTPWACHADGVAALIDEMYKASARPSTTSPSACTLTTIWVFHRRLAGRRRAGAGRSSAPIVGIGERAGHAAPGGDRHGPRHAAHVLQRPCNIVTTKIARRVASSRPYPVGHPGQQGGRRENAFAHEFGIHQDGVLTERPCTDQRRPTSD